MDSAIELALIDSPDAVDMDSCKARNAVFLKPCNAIRIGFDVWTLICRFLDLGCPGQSKKKRDMSKCRNLPKTDGGRKRCSQESLTWRRHVWRASGESLWGGRGRSKWCIWLSGHQMGNKVTVERCKSLADCNSPNSLTLILIEDPTQLSIVHVQPQYILQGNLTLKCRNHIVLLICFWFWQTNTETAVLSTQIYVLSKFYNW